jgi:hypothetical protein
MGAGGPFTGSKARQGREADHSPPSSAEFKNEELQLFSPLPPAWRVAGYSLFLLIIFSEFSTRKKVLLSQISRKATENVVNLILIVELLCFIQTVNPPMLHPFSFRQNLAGRKVCTELRTMSWKRMEQIGYTTPRILKVGAK